MSLANITSQMQQALAIVRPDDIVEYQIYMGGMRVPIEMTLFVANYTTYTITIHRSDFFLEDSARRYSDEEIQTVLIKIFNDVMFERTLLNPEV